MENRKTASPAPLSPEGLCLPLFSDERPPKGFCGIVDWHLFGLISREIAAGRITGRLGEDILVGHLQRLGVSKLLLAGMGPREEISYDRLYQACYHMARTMDGLLCGKYVVPIPQIRREDLTVSGMTEAMITGFYDFLVENRRGSYPFIIFYAPDSYLDEAITGMEGFFARASLDGKGDCFAMEILSDLGEEFLSAQKIQSSDN